MTQNTIKITDGKPDGYLTLQDGNGRDAQELVVGMGESVTWELHTKKVTAIVEINHKLLSNNKIWETIPDASNGWTGKTKANTHGEFVYHIDWEDDGKGANRKKHRHDPKIIVNSK